MTINYVFHFLRRDCATCVSLRHVIVLYFFPRRWWMTVMRMMVARWRSCSNLVSTVSVDVWLQEPETHCVLCTQTLFSAVLWQFAASTSLPVSTHASLINLDSDSSASLRDKWGRTAANVERSSWKWVFRANTNARYGETAWGWKDLRRRPP